MRMQFGLFTEFEWMAGHSGQGTIPPEYEGRLQRYDTIRYDEIYEQQALYGTPEEVIAKIHWLQAETGCNNLLCWMNAGSRLTQEQVLRSMRRFAAEVMLAFPHN
jgi:hypothetical protein